MNSQAKKQVAPRNETAADAAQTKGDVALWITGNWDKLLALFLAVVVSGVIGFFAAISTVKEEIAHLREEIAKLNAERGTYQTKDDMKTVKDDITRLREDMAELKAERKLYETKDEMKTLLIDMDHLKTRVSETIMPSINQLSVHGARIQSVETQIEIIHAQSRFLEKFAPPERR